MVETVRRITSHSTPVVTIPTTKISLSNKEDIRIHKMGFIYKGSYLVHYWDHIILFEFLQVVLTASSVISDKYFFLNPMRPDSSNLTGTTFFSILLKDNATICPLKLGVLDRKAKRDRISLKEGWANR